MDEQLKGIFCEPRLHEARHAVSVDLLKQRIMSQKKATNQKLNNLYSEIQNEKATRQQKIHSDYMRGKKTTISNLT